MAELYLSSEPRAGRFVVLKRILPHLALEPDFVKMFLDEARIAVSLQHPNIIEVFELGQISNSIFIAMEWVEGMDLRRVLQREQARGGVVPPGVAAWLMARLCEGLFYAHTRVGDDGKPLGIIHRDVSPQNVMISYRGEVKLVDFGIAKATAWISRSKPGVIKGKFLYLAPEQLSEEPLDLRCDLFALGVMLYELTTAKSPFYRPETEGVIYAIRMEEPPAPHTLRAGYPLSLSRIIQKCLVKDRTRRFQSADEIRLALEDALLVDMPTTKADVVSYVAGLFGNDYERTGVFVPENAQVNGLNPPSATIADRDLPGAPVSAKTVAENLEEEEEENTASMPAPARPKPVVAAPAPAQVPDDDDDDDENTALIEPPPASAPEVTASMAERPGPPVPDDVQEISYDSVVSIPRSAFDELIALPSPPVTEPSKRGETQRIQSEPNVRVDLDAALLTPPSRPRAPERTERVPQPNPPPEPERVPEPRLEAGATQEPSMPTELQIPAYPPVSSQPLVRPGPPIKDEVTDAGPRPEHRRAEKPGPPVDSGFRAPVARAAEPALLPPAEPQRPAPMPVAPPRQPPPQVRRSGPGPTNLNPLDPMDTDAPRPRARKRRIVKRRVAGDPDDHVATVDFRDNEELDESGVSAVDDAGTSRWLVATTIALSVLAISMIAWLLWPASPTQLPTPRPRDVVRSDLSSKGGQNADEPVPVDKAAPRLVNVQFKAPRSTLIFLEGASINPGEIRQLNPGPLTLAYRCLPTKRGQKARDLTLATRVPAAGSQTFVIELSCR